MIHKILVPLDGSELSERILTHVRRLMVRDRTEIVLIHVLPEKSTPPSEDEIQTASYLTNLVDRLVESGVSAHSHLLSGDPSTEILSFAAAAEPSLIAMSTHGRGGLGRWTRGSVAERVLRHSLHPLLLASPAGLDDERAGARVGFRRILVPLDGSDPDADLLPLVQAIANSYDSEVTLFHVEPVPVSPVAHIPAGTPEVLDRYQKALHDAGVTARVHCETGSYAGCILDAVDEGSADLVVMTTHGRTGFTRWVFGSVAEKVIRNCSVPILALRTPRPDWEGSLEFGW